MYSKTEIPVPNFDETYQKYDDTLRGISLRLHELHELAFHEHKSAVLLSNFLEAEGFKLS
jgi:metal-dependent amidase/aminoacylase/carboxypeptidase family protein